MSGNAKFRRNVAAVVAGASRPQQEVLLGSLHSDGACNYVQIHASNNSVSLRCLGEDSTQCVQDCSATCSSFHDPFKLEALEVIKLGKKLGVSFGIREQDLVERIVHIEERVGGEGGFENHRKIVGQEGGWMPDA